MVGDDCPPVLRHEQLSAVRGQATVGASHCQSQGQNIPKALAGLNGAPFLAFYPEKSLLHQFHVYRKVKTVAFKETQIPIYFERISRI